MCLFFKKKDNWLCLIFYIPHTYPYSTVFIFSTQFLIIISRSLTLSEDIKMSSSNPAWLKYYNICVIFFLFKLSKDLFQAHGEKFQWDSISISSYTSTQFLHTSCHAKLKLFCPNNIDVFLGYYIYGPSTPFHNFRHYLNFHQVRNLFIIPGRYTQSLVFSGTLFQELFIVCRWLVAETLFLNPTYSWAWLECH